jgi:hypothetical protein
VRQLKEQIDADPAQDSRRKAAAQQRAQREMQDRLQSAVEWLPELEAIKRHTASKAEEARASSTDSDASVMKMADGGYGPAYNTQYASDFDSQVIAGVQVSTSGSDLTQLAPMVEQLEQRLGSAPQSSNNAWAARRKACSMRLCPRHGPRRTTRATRPSRTARVQTR